MLILLPALLFADAHAEPGGGGFAETAAQPRYLGVTETARVGDRGYGTMNGDCEALWPRSRMCTDVQILNTYPAPSPAAEAWVFTTIAAAISKDDGDRWFAVSPAGAGDGDRPRRLLRRP